MPTTKPGHKRYQVVLIEDSEMQRTLLEWAKTRGLAPGKATRCILADWSDAMNGRPNPFAAAIAAASGGNSVAGPGQAIQTPSTQEPEMSAEEKAHQKALLQAAQQFL
jgi:hypothetical protein